MPVMSARWDVWVGNLLIAKGLSWGKAQAKKRKHTGKWVSSITGNQMVITVKRSG